MSKVRLGVEELIDHVPRDLRAGRVGMVTSNVATTSAGALSRVALRDAGVNLVRLFGPEHGLVGTAADGAAVADDIDPVTHLPVVSLYGQYVRPTPDALADLDAIIFDIPDVGARFYTYIWTLSHVMEACAEAGKPLYVLDRPNPLGGDLNAVEGPILDEKNLSSFVGRWNIPIRYSLTIAELARLWNIERKIACDLRIVPCANWDRSMHWPDTGLPFVQLSPAMPSYETALFYPGTCLIEGTNLSEGRGTDAPFRLIGSPWLDAEALARSIEDVPGCRAEPATFTPAGRKHAGQVCRGVRLQSTDERSLRPVALGLRLIAAVRRLHPDRFEWLPYETAANQTGHQHFDRLVGSLGVRDAIERSDWTSAPGWRERATPHLLYA
jgi:uncharacterized protein YbbC (DUF1343 family)